MPVESAFRGSLGQRFGLIETLRFQPGEGCIRAERHLARIAASARYFKRNFDMTAAERLLSEVSGAKSLRLRLYLDETDHLTVTTHPFVPVAEGTFWRIAIAGSVRLDANDARLAHKTSLRSHYEKARSEFPASEIEEVILLNKQGHVCEGTITSIFVKRDGMLLTPPLSDGLLAGVLRAELLESGMAVEHRLLPADLENGPIFVGNSLRGLIPAQLVTT